MQTLIFVFPHITTRGTENTRVLLTLPNKNPLAKLTSLQIICGFIFLICLLALGLYDHIISGGLLQAWIKFNPWTDEKSHAQ